MEILKRTMLLTVLLLAGAWALALAQDGDAAEDGLPDETVEESPAPETVSIPLDGTLRFIIQPTILGLVPPRGPEGYGEVFVRIVEAGRTSITVHYEIKEEVPLPPGEEPENGLGGGLLTRIRRGEITADGISASNAILPPLYWGDGPLETDSALLWLSRDSFAALAGEGSCEIDLDYCGPVESDAAAELRAAVEQLEQAAGLQADAAFSLMRVDSGNYPCVVNGRRTRLKALHARDSLGLAEYWVLDDPDNPLVLKLTYTLGDAGEDGGASFLEKGGGYAVTSIDFSPGWDPGR